MLISSTSISPIFPLFAACVSNAFTLLSPTESLNVSFKSTMILPCLRGKQEVKRFQIERQININAFRRCNLILDFLDKHSSSPPSNLAFHPFNTQILIFHFNRKTCSQAVECSSQFQVKNVQLSDLRFQTQPKQLIA